MIYPDATLEEWLLRHPEINVETENCDFCDRARTTTVPFIERDWIGVIAPDCKCGEAGDFVVQIPRSENAQRIYEEYHMWASLLEE